MDFADKDRLMDFAYEQCLEGYHDGVDLSSPEPSDNRSPFYIHGFERGRDDKLVSTGKQDHPSLTAEQARIKWANLCAAEGV